MRRVKDVGPLARQHPRHVNLLAQRVVGRGFEHRPEVGPERRRNAEVALLAEQHVVGVVVEPGELAQQVADVGADAEVVQLARVDGDSHCS